jgi:hypothetical protein
MKITKLLSIAAFLIGSSAYAATFSECPAVGNDTNGCEFLITITAASHGVATAYSITLAQPDQGPFDGADDTLYGVLNSSGTYVSSLYLSSNSDIFDFDGDGVCSGDYGAIPGCAGATGLSGYDPAGVYYDNISPTRTSGTVNFYGPALANGASTFFSLEAQITAPEPASLSLLGFGLIAAGAAFWHRRTA